MLWSYETEIIQNELVEEKYIYKLMAINYMICYYIIIS